MNGESQGVAANDLPPLLYAVVDMYGKCAQITLTQPAHTPDSSEIFIMDTDIILYYNPYLLKTW